MKKTATLMLFISLTFPVLSHAECIISQAKVTSTHRYSDGTIFVNFDQSHNCDCPQKSRFAFREDGMNMDYIKSMILIAYTTGAQVTAKASNTSCSVHGNTPKLDIFQLE